MRQNTRKENCVIDAIRSSRQLQQEVTAKTENRSNLCSLCCLLFKRPSVAGSRRTPSISGASQLPLTPEWKLSETAGSHPLHAVVRPIHGALAALACCGWPSSFSA